CSRHVEATDRAAERHRGQDGAAFRIEHERGAADLALVAGKSFEIARGRFGDDAGRRNPDATARAALVGGAFRAPLKAHRDGLGAVFRGRAIISERERNAEGKRNNSVKISDHVVPFSLPSPTGTPLASGDLPPLFAAKDGPLVGNRFNRGSDFGPVKKCQN